MEMARSVADKDEEHQTQFISRTRKSTCSTEDYETIYRSFQDDLQGFLEGFPNENHPKGRNEPTGVVFETIIAPSKGEGVSGDSLASTLSYADESSGSVQPPTAKKSCIERQWERLLHRKVKNQSRDLLSVKRHILRSQASPSTC